MPASASNLSRSSASYEAVLYDKITESVNNIVESLKKLDEAMTKTKGPAKELSDSMKGIGTSIKGAGKAIQDSGVLATLTRLRTFALSAGQGISQVFATLASNARMVGKALLGFATAAGGFLAVALTKASSAAEQQSRFNIAFGQGAVAANKWADAVSDAMGRGTTQVKTFAATFQTMFVGFGFADELAGNMSQTLTRLTYDMASFNEAMDEDVMYRILAGMTGSTEALERFGINLKASAMDSFLLSKGINATNRQLNEQEKVLTRFLMLLQATQKQQGDVVRTGTSWANQLKALRASMVSLLTQVGLKAQQVLLGPLQMVVNAVGKIGENLGRLTVDHLRSFIAVIATAGFVGAGLLALATALSVIAGGVIALSTAASGLIAFISLLVASPVVAVATAFVAIVAAMGAWAGSVGFVKSFIGQLSDLRKTVDGLFETMLEGGSALLKALSAGEMEAAWKLFKTTAEIVFIEVGQMLTDALTKAIKEGWQAFKDHFAEPFRRAAEDQRRRYGSGFFEDQPRQPTPVEQETDSQVARLKELRAEFKRLTTEIGQMEPGTSGFDKWFEKFQTNTKDSADMVEKTLKELTDRLKPEDNLGTFLEWAQSVETPMEKWEREIALAGQRFEKFGLGSITFFNRAVRAATDAYIKATQPEREDIEEPTPSRFRAASMRASAAGIASALSEFGPSFDPLISETKKQTKLQEAQAEYSKKTTEKLEEIARKTWVFSS